MATDDMLIGRLSKCLNVQMSRPEYKNIIDMLIGRLSKCLDVQMSRPEYKNIITAHLVT